MNRSAEVELDGLILALRAQIRTAARVGCSDVAKIFEMSLLALQMRRYGISDDELKTFCYVAKGPNAAAEIVGDSMRSPSVKIPSAVRRRDFQSRRR